MSDDDTLRPIGPADQGVYYFRRFADLKQIPVAKIDHFCVDLALWLHMLARAKELAGQVSEPGWKAFGWRDDGRHDARIFLIERRPAPEARQGEREGT